MKGFGWKSTKFFAYENLRSPRNVMRLPFVLCCGIRLKRKVGWALPKWRWSAFWNLKVNSVEPNGTYKCHSLTVADKSRSIPASPEMLWHTIHKRLLIIKFSPLSAPTKIEELTARSDEKTQRSPAGNRTQGLANSSRTLYPRSYEATTGTACEFSTFTTG